MIAYHPHLPDALVPEATAHIVLALHGGLPTLISVNRSLRQSSREDDIDHRRNIDSKMKRRRRNFRGQLRADALVPYWLDEGILWSLQYF